MNVKLYDGTINVTFQEGNHRYKVEGEYKTGVTTILGLLNKPHLIQWAANMCAEAVKNGEEPSEARYAHLRKRDKSADTGSKVHKWIEEFLQGNELPIDKDMRPSVNAFNRWFGEDVEVIESERIVYSRTYDYAGTVDIVFNRGGKRYVADFKTSDPDKEFKKFYTGRTRARTEHYLQNALYDQALTEELGVKADAYMVIYITKDGKLLTYETTDTDQYREAALSLVKTYQLNKLLDFKNEWRNHGED